MSSPAKDCKLCKKFGLKPLNKSTAMFYYTPAFGLLNYTALSVNVMNPGLLMRLFPTRDVTNVLLMNSMVGSAFYLYNRPHLLQAPNHIRLLYSGYNAVIFNFGSVLIWAVLRSLAPRSNCIATIMGFLTGISLVAVGRTCLDYLDSRLDTKSHEK